MKKPTPLLVSAVIILFAATNAAANTALTEKLPDLVAQGYEIRGTGISQRQTGSTLYYDVVTVLEKDRATVQCFQSWDAYFQEQSHRCIRLDAS